ncbi:hypothetical protein V5799_016251 [Amblyomma americanum]|uniref:Uncharacterized protein n=1 Tax=Amblyomma americanum TaxID=6943 RepID=A0AAQ4F6Z1_AMBAM
MVNIQMEDQGVRGLCGRNTALHIGHGNKLSSGGSASRKDPFRQPGGTPWRAWAPGEAAERTPRGSNRGQRVQHAGGGCVKDKELHFLGCSLLLGSDGGAPGRGG